MQLRGKVILLISPESWGKLFISKHNYAVTLAARHNTVYFLSPVENELSRGEVKIIPVNEYPGLSVIKYQPFFPLILRFHAKWLFDRLMKYQVKRVLKKISTPIDIVWDFNCSNLFPDLRIFQAKFSIFHPVDLIQFKPGENKISDVILSVSKHSLAKLDYLKTPSFFINHGLSELYVNAAMNRTETPKKHNDILQVCYIGNILINTLDRQVVINLVKTFKQVHFNFIGPYKNTDNNIGFASMNKEDQLFIDFLQTSENVTLKGVMKGEEICKILDDFDLFFLCYKETPFFKNDNSHKVLEYLSSGKVIVTSSLEYYKDVELMVMSETSDNSDIPFLFEKVIGNIEFWNAEITQKKRIEYAVKNSYENQIERIEEIISPLYHA